MAKGIMGLGMKVLIGLLFSQSLWSQESTSESIERLSLPRTAALYTSSGSQPRKKGEIQCYQLNLSADQKKTICNYLPKYDLASNLQSRILRTFFGGRQPANPDEAYITVLANGQLEYAHTDPEFIRIISEKLNDFDVLDTFVERRKVNIQVHILQLVENAGSNLGYMLTARYGGSKGAPIEPTDRFGISNADGILNSSFAVGNLVNSLLNIQLNNFKSNREIKVVSSLPLSLTHGYSLSSVSPYSRNAYINTSSLSSITEQIGIRFDGNTRFHENTNSKIVIKDFSASVSQFLPGEAEKREGVVEGVETFKTPTRDLELEIGCSTAIRVVTLRQKATTKERNWWFSRSDEAGESKSDFLFIIQAIDDTVGSQASERCSETSVTVPMSGKN